MERAQLLEWLEAHRDQVRGEPSEIVGRCEREVRRHAEEDAWLAAKQYVEGRMHRWEKQWGFHASEAHVAREVCPRLADDLRRHEPHPAPGDETHLAGAELLASLGPEARARVIEWVLELAAAEEHKAWLEVVKFTRGRGRGMVREGLVSGDQSWEGTENYAQKAAHVAELLAHEYEDHIDRSD